MPTKVGSDALTYEKEGLKREMGGGNKKSIFVRAGVRNVIPSGVKTGTAWSSSGV